MVGFVSERDNGTDHLRFAPKQTKFATQLCQSYNMPEDMSTAVLITSYDDEHSISNKDYVGHTHSDAVLLLFPHLQSPYPTIGRMLRYLFPKIVRDFGYSIFAHYRGTIWKIVKQLTGMGDVQMEKYRDRILGLEEEEEPLDSSWGFSTTTSKES